MKEKGDVLMPQLNKGGKFVFGLSLIHDDLTVALFVTIRHEPKYGTIQN